MAKPKTIKTWVRSPFFQNSAKYCCIAPRADSSTGSSNSGAVVGGGVSTTALAVAVGAGVELGVGVGVAAVVPFPFAGVGVGVGVGAGTGLQVVLFGLVAARQAP